MCASSFQKCDFQFDLFVLSRSWVIHGCAVLPQHTLAAGICSTFKHTLHNSKHMRAENWNISEYSEYFRIFQNISEYSEYPAAKTQKDRVAQSAWDHTETQHLGCAVSACLPEKLEFYQRCSLCFHDCQRYQEGSFKKPLVLKCRVWWMKALGMLLCDFLLRSACGSNSGDCLHLYERANPGILYSA